MRVNDLNLTGGSAAETGRAQGSQAIDREGRSGSSGRSGSGSDQVDLSPLSRALNASSAARSTRVQQLSAEFHAGQYQVDPEEVSQAIVSDALQASAFKF